MHAFPRLFEPLQIGTVTVRNRFLFAAHGTQFSSTDPSGYGRFTTYSERAPHYYAERAQGGWGLIVTNTNYATTARPPQVTASAPELVVSYRKIADAVHAAGGTVFAQLDAGRKRELGADLRDPFVGPLAEGPGERGQMDKMADEEDLEALIRAYVASALHMHAGGMDGLELHLTHNHNLAKFLYPGTNRRTDQYGGSLENRLRLPLRILAAIREAIGRRWVIGARISAGYAPYGQTEEEGIEVARRLAASGLLDYLNVSGFPIFSGPGSPRGSRSAATAAVRAAVDGQLPVFGAGERVVDPRMAERIIAAGAADMVAMARAGIADPELPNKARDGRLADIRTCVGTGEGCLGYFDQGAPMMCIQNPVVGNEATWGSGKTRPAQVSKRVLVIGAGPAGLEAALVAAQRGHQVTLFEKEQAAGGQLNYIRKSPRRDEYRYVTEWRLHELAKLGVPVQLGREVTPDMVVAAAPDAVVLATGSRPRVRGTLPGAEQAHVLSPWELLSGRADRARHVAVVDASGYYQGTDCVEYLAARGIRVSFVTQSPAFAASAPMNDAPGIMAFLSGKEVAYHLNTRVARIRPRAVETIESVSGRQALIEDVDAVVLSLGADPVDSLYQALRGKIADLRRIGDCLAPRGIEHATFEGHRAGQGL